MLITKGEDKGHRFRGNQHTGGIKGILRQIASGSNLITLDDGTRIAIIDHTKSANPSDRGYKTIVRGPSVVQEMQGIEPTRAGAVLEGLRQYREGTSVPQPTVLASPGLLTDEFTLQPPVPPKRKKWRGGGMRDYYLTGADPDSDDETAAALELIPSFEVDYEPFPGMTATEAEANAVATVGDYWIDGSWTELRGYAMDLRQNDRVYDVAARELNPDDMTVPGGVTLFGEEEPHLPSDAIQQAIEWQVARTLSVISRAPSSKVYRGMVVSDDVYDRLTTIGYEYDESLATATGSRTLAEGFAKDDYSTAEQIKENFGDPRIGDNHVLLAITGNNVPIKPPVMDEIELDLAQFEAAIGRPAKLNQMVQRQAYLELSDERMISGKYRVVDVDYGIGTTTVEVERVGD